VETLNDKLKGKKLELEYPCNWCYKVIGNDKESVTNAVKDVLDEREHKLTHSNNSKSGKYVSMNLDMLVHNEDDRKELYQILNDHEHIKMVV